MKKKLILIVGLIAAIGISACSDKNDENTVPAVAGDVVETTDKSGVITEDNNTSDENLSGDNNEQTTENGTENKQELEPVSVDIIMVGDILSL